MGWGTVVVMVAALGLLAPATGHAQVVGTTFQKLFTQTDPPDASGSDMEIWALNDAAHLAFVTERTDGTEGYYFWDGQASKFLEPSASVWTPGGTNNADQVVAALETG